MGGAIGVGFFAFRLAARKGKAWNGQPIRLPDTTLIDKRLILGGVWFGIGWGVGGFCPGPGIVAAAAGVPEAAVFVVTMLVGMAAYDLFAERKH
jgi:uncharacterized membrane protein YedE/YeeE